MNSNKLNTMFFLIHFTIFCVFRYYSNFILPDGNRRDDQTSCDPQSGDNGGQLMTGQTAFPDNTGPKPLLLPATAINTVGIPSPKIDITQK